MQTEEPAANPVVTALRLQAQGMEPAARRLGLRAGDQLEAINGLPFRGDEAALRARLGARGGKALALQFRRGTETFLVLVDAARLGRWEAVPCPLPESDVQERVDPEGLQNFEVMRSAAGVYDLYPLKAPILAMIAPPVWLLQMRLWAPGATLVAALAAATVVHPLLGLGVWAAAGVWVRQSAAAFLRADRMMRGLAFEGAIAATGEAAAHAAHLRLNPQDRYLFAPPAAQAAQAA